MATSDQLKALLQSYTEGDESQFFAVAMQIAAHEARIGHGELAKQLRNIIDDAKTRQKGGRFTKTPTPIFQPQGELSALLTASFPKLRLPDMTLGSGVSLRLLRIIEELRQITKLRSHGLSPRRKFLLLLGPPGTGKTMTASALAGELGLPLLVARMDGIITKYMGETSSKLRIIFEALKHNRGVYLFDEFDSIGTTRASGNDVGEMRRILNSFLQFMDEDNSESLILSATNHPGILDPALFRRFYYVIEYALPDKESRIRLLQNRLASYKKIEINWGKLADAATNISHADITRACDDAIKDMIIHDRNGITQKDILQMITERKILDKKHYNQNKQDLTTFK